jgi:hypothetical protein
MAQQQARHLKQYYGIVVLNDRENKQVMRKKFVLRSFAKRCVLFGEARRGLLSGGGRRGSQDEVAGELATELGVFFSKTWQEADQ